MGEITARSRYKSKHGRARYSNLSDGLESDADGQEDALQLECYKCGICFRQFTRKCAFNQHKNDLPNCLAACDRSNGNGESLQSKKRRRKDNDHAKFLDSEDSSSDSEEDCAVKCIICEKNFKSPKDLTNHIVQDHNEDNEIPEPANANQTPPTLANCDVDKQRAENEKNDAKPPDTMDVAELIDFEVPLAKYSQEPIRIPKGLQRKKILTNNFRVTDIWKIEKPTGNPKVNASPSKKEEKDSPKPVIKKKRKERVIKRKSAENQKISLNKKNNGSNVRNIERKRKTFRHDKMKIMEHRKRERTIGKVKNKRETLKRDRVENVKDKNHSLVNVCKPMNETKEDGEIKELVKQTTTPDKLDRIDVTLQKDNVAEKEVDFDEYFESRLKNLAPSATNHSPSDDKNICPKEESSESKLQKENTGSDSSKENITKEINIEALLAESFKVPTKMPKNLTIAKVNNVMNADADATSIIEEANEKKAEQGIDDCDTKLSTPLITYSYLKGLRVNAKNEMNDKKFESISTSNPITTIFEKRNETKPIEFNGEKKFASSEESCIINITNEAEKKILTCPDLRRRVARISKVKPMCRSPKKVLKTEQSKDSVRKTKLECVVEPLNKVVSFSENSYQLENEVINSITPEESSSIETPTEPKISELSKLLNRAIRSQQITITVKTADTNKNAKETIPLSNTPTIDIIPSYLKGVQPDNSNSGNIATKYGQTTIIKKRTIYKNDHAANNVPVQVIQQSPTLLNKTNNLTPLSTSIPCTEVPNTIISYQAQTNKPVNVDDSIQTYHFNCETGTVVAVNPFPTVGNERVDINTSSAELHGCLPDFISRTNVACSSESNSTLYAQQLNIPPIAVQAPQYLVPANIMQYSTPAPVFLLDNNVIGTPQPVNVQLYQNQANGFTQIKPSQPAAVSIVNGMAPVPFHSLPPYVTVSNPIAGGFQLVQNVNSMTNLPFVILKHKC